MNVTTQFVIYYGILLFASVSAMQRFNKLEQPLKIICLWLCCTLISEGLAAFMSKYHHNNMMVYHFYSPVNLMLLSLYFNYSIPVFQKHKIGYIICVVGLVAAVLNTVFFQTLATLDSNFILFEGVCIAFMSLFAFYTMFTDETGLPLIRNIHFWLAFLFLFYWCGTFLIWALLQALIIMKEHDAIKPVYFLLWIINLIKYMGIGLIFLTLSTKNIAYEKSKAFR